MFRYQILLEYDGKSFVGWQIQKKGKSVQEIVQLELSRLFKNKITLMPLNYVNSDPFSSATMKVTKVKNNRKRVNDYEYV